MVLRASLNDLRPAMAVPAGHVAWLLRFDDLGVDRLYRLLTLRSEVFVLEQRCLYLDCDGLDPRALHLGIEDGAGLVAYARLFLPMASNPPEARIGRVVTARRARGEGLGDLVLGLALGSLAELGPNVPIALSAQAHLVHWYARHGFVPCGEPHDEDGIPHVEMRRPAS
jgi:ElaA protein